MTHKMSIPQSLIQWILCIVLFTLSSALSAQEVSDSIYRIQNHESTFSGVGFMQSPSELFPDLLINSYTTPLASRMPITIPHFTLKEEIRLPYYTNPSPIYKGDYSTGGVYKQFSHGAILGSGKQTTMPGIGLLNEASMGYAHSFNDQWEMQGSVNATKINMMQMKGQTFSTSGALLYRPTDAVTLKVFGTYNINDPLRMNADRYGATVAFDMSQRFNLEMGVQRYYDSMRGCWETVPVVIPTYRFDKFNLGLDVGGIVYEILRSTVFDRDQYSGGPTIAPPHFPMHIK